MCLRPALTGRRAGSLRPDLPDAPHAPPPLSPLPRGMARATSPCLQHGPPQLSLSQGIVPPRSHAYGTRVTVTCVRPPRVPAGQAAGAGDPTEDWADWRPPPPLCLYPSVACSGSSQPCLRAPWRWGARQPPMSLVTLTLSQLLNSCLLSAQEPAGINWAAERRQCWGLGEQGVGRPAGVRGGIRSRPLLPGTTPSAGSWRRRDPWTWDPGSRN